MACTPTAGLAGMNPRREEITGRYRPNDYSPITVI